MAEGTVGHGIGLDGIGLLPQIAPRTQQRQPLDRLTWHPVATPSFHGRHRQIPTSTVPQKHHLLPLLHHTFQRLVGIVVRGWERVFWRQAVKRQHHPTARHTGQMNGRSSVYARAPKRKRSAMHPHHSPFVVFFPSDFGTLPPISLALVKLSAPRSRIQSGGQFNGVANLLGRDLGHIPPHHAACTIGAL